MVATTVMMAVTKALMMAPTKVARLARMPAGLVGLRVNRERLVPEAKVASADVVVVARAARFSSLKTVRPIAR